MQAAFAIMVILSAMPPQYLFRLRTKFMFLLMQSSSLGKLIVSFIISFTRPFIQSCILITSTQMRIYPIFISFCGCVSVWNRDASFASLQTDHCISSPIPHILFSCLRSKSHDRYVIGKHAFPKCRVFQSKFLRYFKGQSEIYNNYLMFLLIFGVRSNKHVSRMRITMDKSCHKDLLGKGTNQIIHHLFFVELVLIHLLAVCDFESLNPFRNHYPFRSQLFYNIRYVQLLSFYR